MAVRASNVLPVIAYKQARELALQIKNLLTLRRTQFQSDTSAELILNTFQDIRRIRNEIQTAASVPGIAAYAQAQENDPAYDVVAEWNALISSITTAMGLVTSTFPTSTGYLLEKQFAADGSYTYRVFTAAQLSNLRTAFDNVIALIS